MRSPLLLRLVILVLLIVVARSGDRAEAVDGAKRVALVIGNSKYQHTQVLTNPANDARLMASVLAKQGFEVLAHTDLTFKGMKRAVQDFTSKLEEYGKDTVGLIFYAGHGLQSNGSNYLVPVDARIDKEGDVEIETISSSALLSGVQFAGNRLNIIILDACRNNPYRGLFRSAARGLARMDAPVGSLLAFSTAPGTVALDGDSDNSPYTAALANAIAEPGLKLEDVFKHVRQQVYASTSGQQIPWESSSVFGDFYFSKATAVPGPAAARQPVAPPIDERAIELAYWNSIKDAKNARAFEAYLGQFPKGEFVALANLKLEEIRAQEEAAARAKKQAETKKNNTQLGAPAPATAAPSERPPQTREAGDSAYELVYWNSIKGGANAAEFESYLKAYPNGAFRELAKLRIEELREGAKQAALEPGEPPTASEPERRGFDGVWKVTRHSPACRRVSAKFQIVIKGRHATWGKGNGRVSDDGTIHLKTKVLDGRQGTFTGKIVGNQGGGRFTGRHLKFNKSCSGTFTITRVN